MALALATVIFALFCQSAFAGDGKIHKKGKTIKGEYLVAFHESVSGEGARVLAAELASQYGGAVKVVWTDVRPGAWFETMKEKAAADLALHPLVRLVEENGELELSSTQTGASWNLSRLDDATPIIAPATQPNTEFNYCTSGAGIAAYVIDSGVRGSHEEFWTSASNTTSRVMTGHHAAGTGGSGTANDPCNQQLQASITECGGDPLCLRGGHGTAVASIIAGRTYGVAKGATIIPVRVVDCAAVGSVGTLAGGLRWIIGNYPGLGSPAIANMSFVFEVATNDTTDVQGLVNEMVTQGITVVAAAGNQGADVQNYFPANMGRTAGGTVITVGGTALTPSKANDKRWICAQDGTDPGETCGNDIGSNWGVGVDIFAPAHLVSAAGIKVDNGFGNVFNSDSASRLRGRSGTSFSAPAVTGRALRAQTGTWPYPYTPYDVWNLIQTYSKTGTFDQSIAPLNGSNPLHLFVPKGVTHNCS